MTLKDKILALSTLPGCATLTEHICSAIVGVNIDARVYGTYPVKYIPTPRSKMMYVLPSKIGIEYVPKAPINIVYVKSVKQAIQYKASPTIKIVHKCKP